MSDDRDARSWPELDELVRRAQREWGAWTDDVQHDPGTTFVELLAYVGEQLLEHAERLAGEAQLAGRHEPRSAAGPAGDVRHGPGRRYSSVLRQQGRVSIDADWSEAPALMACGIYRATVVDNADPLAKRRLHVLVPHVPGVSGDEEVWAAACLPTAGSDAAPGIGDGVWVAFEEGDPSRPVWMGRLVAS